MPPNITESNERQGEIGLINENLKKEHILLQTQLLSIAKNDSHGKLGLHSDTESSDKSDSFVKIPSNIANDPVVSSLAMLINNLDLDSLKIDWQNLPFDINNVTLQILSSFLKALFRNSN